MRVLTAVPVGLFALVVFVVMLIVSFPWMVYFLGRECLGEKDAFVDGRLPLDVLGDWLERRG